MNIEYSAIYGYLDELLRLQSKAADMFEHKGVLGTVRENFLIKQICERVDNPLIHTGQVIAKNVNAGQVDIIIRRKNTLNPDLGGQARIVSSDCAGLIEVKTNATGTDFRDFNNKAEAIKRENNFAVCGIFCYKLDCRKITILNRFGFKHDRSTQSFEPDEELSLTYPNIDFVFCLDDSQECVSNSDIFYNKFFFLSKQIPPEIGYNIFLKPPFSFYFLTEIRRQTTGTT